jgi:hypothetical protein
VVLDASFANVRHARVTKCRAAQPSRRARVASRRVASRRDRSPLDAYSTRFIAIAHIFHTFPRARASASVEGNER